MTTFRSPITPTAPQVAYRRLLWVTPAAAAIAALLNSIVYFAADSLGAFPADVLIPNRNMPMTLLPIVMFSIFPTIGAAIAFALLGRFTKKPVRNFLILSTVVFVAFIITPFTIPDAPVLMNIALQITHIVVAGVAVYAFTHYATTD